MAQSAHRCRDKLPRDSVFEPRVFACMLRVDAGWLDGSCLGPYTFYRTQEPAIHPDFIQFHWLTEFTLDVFLRMGRP